MTAQGIEAAQADETRSGSAVGESPTRRDAPPSPPLPPEGLPEEIASYRDKIRITFERRPDGGLRVSSDELPGLVLSHAEHAAVLADLKPAIEGLLSHRLSAALARAERAEKALKTAQAALAMLTEPNEIRLTSVANAWAIAVDAELQCRRALSASIAEEA